MITQTTERQILAKLERIENLLFNIIPNPNENKLNEDDVLEIVKRGDQEYHSKQTADFDTFIRTQCPKIRQK